MSKHVNPRARDFVDPVTSVLASKTLKSNRYNPSFKTGVSVRASLNSNHFFTLFMSIPYFGEPPLKKFSSNVSFKADAAKLTEYREGYQPDWRRESLSLFEYRFQWSNRERRRDTDETTESRVGYGDRGEGEDSGENKDETGTSMISPVNGEPVALARASTADNEGPIRPRPRRWGLETIESGRKRDNCVEQDILVHQAWFIVLDNRSFLLSFFLLTFKIFKYVLMDLETMAIFRSADDQTSDHDPQQPLFSYQERVGAFRALVHAISNIFEYSERTLLDIYNDKASRFVSIHPPIFS